MTDREKLIELMFVGQVLADAMCDKQEKCDKCQYKAPNACRCGFIADHLIANGVTIQKWIPVTERLPQGADGKSLCKNVIAYTIDGQVVPGWLNGAYWYLLLQDDTDFTRLERDCVTHWMPLPQPPKGE